MKQPMSRQRNIWVSFKTVTTRRRVPLFTARRTVDNRHVKRSDGLFGGGCAYHENRSHYNGQAVVVTKTVTQVKLMEVGDSSGNFSVQETFCILIFPILFFSSETTRVIFLFIFFFSFSRPRHARCVIVPHMRVCVKKYIYIPVSTNSRI